MNEDEQTSFRKREMVYADINVVQELFNEINSYLNSKDIRVLECMTALISLIITKSLDSGLSKATVLYNISNTWELNDPDNDHPRRGMNPYIKY